MNIPSFAPLVWMLFLNAALLAQTPRQYLAAGDKELKDGFPESAIFYYGKALSLDTTVAEGHFKVAESYRMLRNYKRAAGYYQTATDLDAAGKYPEAHFWLAMMLKQTGNYRDAATRFDYFLQIYRTRDDLYRWARDEVESCEWALEHQHDAPAYKVSRPDSGLNTVHAELSPCLLDTLTLYFATVRYQSDKVKKSNPEYIEIRKAVKDTASFWKLEDPGIPFAHRAAHIANPSFSKDRLRVYYSHCTRLGSCKVYVSRRDSGSSTWSGAVPLGSPVNEEGSSSTQPMVVQLEDDEYLFFASDRERGKGGMDIWFAELKNGEPLRRVRNLGSRVNTRGDEITPWFDAHDSTLYFSSNRQQGFGGFDIFITRGAPGSFEIVQNAGTQINTSADDYYPTVLRRDSVGYFASNRSSGLKRSGNETCCNDIYKLRLLPEPVEKVPEEDSAVVTVADTLQPKGEPIPETIEDLQEYLPITLYFHNDRPNPRSLDTVTHETYTATLMDYRARLGEYLGHIASSKLNEYEKELAKQKTEEFFQYKVGQSEELLEQATAVLLKELQRGAKIKLAVKGYASPLAKSNYNLNLTLRRISSMVNFLRSYGDGALIPYLEGTATNGGRLIIVKIPYGESKASDTVSDQRTDRYSSIYSIDAAKERRIEILRIERTNDSR